MAVLADGVLHASDVQPADDHAKELERDRETSRDQEDGDGGDAQTCLRSSEKGCKVRSIAEGVFSHNTPSGDWISMC